jgi:hypothetical protein
MSLPKIDVRAKVIPAAHARLAAIAMSRGMSIDCLTGEIVERTMLGEGYKEILAAEEMYRSGIIGKNRE